MMRRIKWQFIGLVAALAVVFAGCSDDEATGGSNDPADIPRGDQGGQDVGGTDTSTADTGPLDLGQPDTQVTTDTGTVDTGTVDTGAEDAGADDAGGGDAPTDDAGGGDAPTDDAGGGDAPTDDGGDAALDDASDDASDDAVSDDLADTEVDDVTEDLADTGDDAPLAGTTDLVFVEVQGNPHFADDDETEYFEVMNVSDGPRQLQGVSFSYHEAANALPVTFSDGASFPNIKVFAVADSLVLDAGEVAVFARSAIALGENYTPDETYDAFLITNGGSRHARMWIHTVGFEGTVPDATFLADELDLPAGVFDNDNGLRGRAIQLDPNKVADPSSDNNGLTNWCYTDVYGDGSESFGYDPTNTNNTGTPTYANDCSGGLAYTE